MPSGGIAQQGGGGQMSWETYSWLLLRACGCNQHQLLNILQPTMGRFPTTEVEFNAMQMTLRRTGHILEGVPLNLAGQLRAPPNRHVAAWPESQDASETGMQDQQQTAYVTGATQPESHGPSWGAANTDQWGTPPSASPPLFGSGSRQVRLA